MSVRRRFAPPSAVCVLLASLWCVTPLTAGRPAQGPAAPNRDGGAGATTEAFRSGRLPEPARMPPGGPDEQAAALAKAVRANDGNSTAALYAAILAAGFGVRAADGSLVQTRTPGQGLALDAWEVAALAKLSGDGAEMRLSDLASAVKVAAAPAAPQLTAERVSAAAVEALRAQAQGDSPELRFWARFVVELGRGEPRGLDPAKPQEPSEVHLHPVQVSLILHRLGGDLFALALRGADGGRAGGPAQPGPASQGAPALFVKAGYAPRGQIKLKERKGTPCKVQVDSTLFDFSALIITTANSKLLEWMAESVKAESEALANAVEKYGKFAAAANILLAYAKLITTYASLDTKLSIEGPLPLVRTKLTNQSGQLRKLAAKVTVDAGDWQSINCLRTALNLVTGLDINALDNGPVPDATVVWKLDAGGDEKHSTGQGQFVGFVGKSRVQDFVADRGKQPPDIGLRELGRADVSKTDKEGVATAVIGGTPMRYRGAYSVVPVMREATVRTVVRLKSGDIKGDAVDVLGQAAGGPAGLLTMPAELLYRTDWFSTASLSFPVRDWERCDGGWHGTITFTEVGSLNQPYGDYNYKGSRSATYSHKETLRVTGVISERKTFMRLALSGSAEGSQSAEYSALKSYMRGCQALNPEKKEVRSEARGSSSLAGANQVSDKPLSISFSPDGRSYEIVFRPAGVDLKGKTTHFKYDSDGCLAHAKRHDLKTTDVQTTYGLEDFRLKGTLDPDEPNTLSGSFSKVRTQTVYSSPSVTTSLVITWELSACR